MSLGLVTKYQLLSDKDLIKKGQEKIIIIDKDLKSDVDESLEAFAVVVQYVTG